MKKLISFVMAAAMVASLVPATAFAAQSDVTATAKVVGALTVDKDTTTGNISTPAGVDVPELQLKVTGAEYTADADTTAPVAVVTVTLDNATFKTGTWTAADNRVGIRPDDPLSTTTVNGVRVDDDELELTITGKLAKDDVIWVKLASDMDKTNKNATVSVDSDDITVSATDLIYVNAEESAFTASVKKAVKVAVEEKVTLNDLVLKETVDGTFAAQPAADDDITLKLNNGFEFTATNDREMVIANGVAAHVNGKITLADIEIEATTAKADATATITITIPGFDKVTVDVAEVVDYVVVMSVDEDEDVPVIYSGVDVDNTGITDDSDHETLEITLEESFPGAWSSRQGFDITLPDGVYVTDVDVKNAENFFDDGVELTEARWEALFRAAYTDGSESNFEFDKRVFDDVDVTLQEDPASLTFVLTLIAEPGFEGDVEVGFEGALVDSQSVVAAKFVAPYTVTAEQNDIKIDSRYTDLGTPLVIKEAADGLWEKDAEFMFTVETGYIQFEDTADYTADNEMELKSTGDTNRFDLSFTVKTESDKAATVTIDDIQLMLDRTVPEGPYTLQLNSSLAGWAGGADGFINEGLFTNDANNNTMDEVLSVDNGDWYTVDVKDKFVNIITAPRDEDGFTTKISVPVGESYIIAGEKKVEIDTPAYINANGYTMLPLRAVAVALGVDNNSVIWDQATRTATILYGNRIVSMQNGANVMYINAQAVPTKAGVEITNNRTFLSLRDLGTAMNVTDITWDAATRTAYLNAGVEA